MSDLVERLRNWTEVYPEEAGDAEGSLYGKAADEIEQNRIDLEEYRLDVERLRAALRDCLSWHDYSNDMHKPIEVRAAYMRARAALEEK